MLRVIAFVFVIFASAFCSRAWAEIEFSTGSLSVLETDGTATLTVIRTGVAPNTAASVTIVVTHGTATSGTDYVITGTTLTWGVGETGTRTAVVSITQDTVAEGTETAYFALTSVTGDTLGAQETLQLSIIDPNLTVANDEGLTEQQYDAAVVLDNLCGSVNGASIEGCTLLQTLSDAEQVQTLETILPRNVMQHASTVGVAQSGSDQSIRMRMQNVRVGNVNPLVGLSIVSPDGSQSLAGLLAGDGASYFGGNAGDGGVGERWGIFLSGQIQTTEQDSTSEVLGYQSDANQITAGVDYRLGSRLFLGSALSYSLASTDSNADAGSQDTSIAILSVFGSYYFTDEWYLDAVLSAGVADFEMDRNFRFGETVARATADTSGQQFGLSLGGGYEVAVDYWQFAGYARVDFSQATIDAYEESGGAGLGLAIDERESESSQALLGGSIALVKSVSYGVVIPKFTAEWVHGIDDSVSDTRARFVADPSSGFFVLRAPDMDMDYFNVGGSLVATFRHGLSAYVRYEAAVGRDDYISETVDLGGRWAF